MADLASLLDEARQMLPELVALRRALHEEPELGLELPKTREKVLERLEALPLEIDPEAESKLARRHVPDQAAAAEIEVDVVHCLVVRELIDELRNVDVARRESADLSRQRTWRGTFARLRATAAR